MHDIKNNLNNKDMKKFVFALVALFTMTIQASAMSYEQAREQALFLTDKMAYELNLTDDQYEVAYEVNLDYLMGINDYDDLYGAYWTRRNLDLSYILLDWQYRMYLDASYFYRPLYWDGGYWHFGIYARYPHRDYYFFGRPTFYVNYRGGHSWAMNGGRSWYHGRSYGTIANGRSRMGMRDGFNRGDYGRGTRYSSKGSRSFGNGGVRYDNNQQNRTRSFGNNNGNRSFGNSNGNRSFGTNNGNRSFGTSNGSRSFDNGSTSVAQQNRTRSFGSSRESSTRTTVTRPESSSRYFGNHGNSSSPSRTFTPNSSSREFAPSRSTPSRSSSSFGSSSSRSYSPSPSSFGSGRSQSSPSRGFGGGNVGGTRSSGSSSNNGGGRFGGHR